MKMTDTWQKFAVIYNKKNWHHLTKLILLLALQFCPEVSLWDDNGSFLHLLWQLISTYVALTMCNHVEWFSDVLQ
jgi:hypothetical protein